MRNYMTKKFEESLSRFFECFLYYPNLPSEIEFDQVVYAKLLDKCVEDNFDYTIDKYGTKPEPYLQLGRPDIIID